MKQTGDLKTERLIDEADHQYACLDRPAKALQKIEEALRLVPNHVGALVIKGRILFHLDRVQAAMQCYDNAIAIDPKCSEGFLERARILYALNQENRKALREVKKALTRAGQDRWVKVQALRLQGEILSALDRNGAALASYQAALRVSPKDGETHAALGEAFLAMGHPAKALPHFDFALRKLQRERHPNQTTLALTFHGKGEALNALGRHHDALEVIEAGLRRVKGDDREYLQDLRGQTKRLAREVLEAAG